MVWRYTHLFANIKEKNMENIKNKNWKKYGIEFLSIFIAVISAFALNNWNENRRNDNSKDKILIEISNGLEKDLDDIKQNVIGHKLGISACNYFLQAISGKDVDPDSLIFHYFKLTRDFVLIQNIAGYETLKSKGLELIKNDTLRLKIISLYEYDYSSLRKLEEEYSEMQFHENYFKEINEEIAQNLNIDENGNIIGVDLPLKIQEKVKNKLLLYLREIRTNRVFILTYYKELEKKINEVRENIEKNNAS